MNPFSFPKRAGRITASLSVAALLLASSLVACGSDDDGEDRGAAFGTLELAVSGLPFDDAAKVTVTGPNGFSDIFLDSETIGGLEPGRYEIFADGVVFAGTTSDVFYEPEPSRRTVDVRAGERATAEIEYRLASDPPISTTGQLRVEVTGLPAGASASITVSGPAGYEVALSDSEVLRDLEPGSYTIIAAEVEVRGEIYVPFVDPSPAEVEVEAVTQVEVAYLMEIIEPA